MWDGQEGGREERRDYEVERARGRVGVREGGIKGLDEGERGGRKGGIQGEMHTYLWPILYRCM